jgi:hypothetical protein
MRRQRFDSYTRLALPCRQITGTHRHRGVDDVAARPADCHEERLGGGVAGNDLDLGHDTFDMSPLKGLAWQALANPCTQLRGLSSSCVLVACYPVSAWLGTDPETTPRQRSERDQIDRGGLLLWVRLWNAEDEGRAIEILGRHSAREVHVHPSLLGHKEAKGSASALYGSRQRGANCRLARARVRTISCRSKQLAS